MKLFVGLLVSFVSIVATTIAFAYSRGPYLPQDENLNIPGKLLARGNLNERCEDRNEDLYEEPCAPYSEYVLLSSQTGFFEFGIVNYDCEVIDDGAYGALSCRQTGYVKMKDFVSCTDQQGLVAAPGDFVYRDWICTP